MSIEITLNILVLTIVSGQSLEFLDAVKNFLYICIYIFTLSKALTYEKQLQGEHTTYIVLSFCSITDVYMWWRRMKYQLHLPS